MLKRTVCFESSAHLSFKNGQLVYTPKPEGEVRTVPVEDIGFVVLDNHSITLSLRLIEELTANNAAIVFCDKLHHPAAMSVPFDGNTTHAETLAAQLEMSEPLKKQLWKQTVEMKIKNQAAMLERTGSGGVEALRRYAASVKSGDADNREGAAARIYWQNLFGDNFRRERFGGAPNHLLNYVYAILRAAVARSLVGSGLYPAIGIHHHNKYNAYALADDVMEPYRPYADDIVYNIWKETEEPIEELTREHKQQLLKLLASDVHLTNTLRPLMVGLSTTTASLARCVGGTQKKVDYPVMKAVQNVGGAA
ncbi:type II CRISPR-associated endonuclease Cas1 [Tichowtungia aerotolerans]|uniref:CRISPR-associated endonuclease Cas1 n=1 Tax=Tichowtungia aerotolerans TaxID=2697043 RepID=A0A6P1MC59_9BACT|nr:type II CRISPR-associated endonuclease Cas1 [Tichowtungia aerotolerans]QHI70693.1 type II CRISPR-associated endonuclease Cas1 [Tichowtungia aerotolerans]